MFEIIRNVGVQYACIIRLSVNGVSSCLDELNH